MSLLRFAYRLPNPGLAEVPRRDSKSCGNRFVTSGALRAEASAMDMVRVRAAVGEMDREMGTLPLPAQALQGAWSQLVTALALGPAPATRNCPRCGNSGMRDATLCGYCWMKLVPPAGTGA